MSDIKQLTPGMCYLFRSHVYTVNKGKCLEVTRTSTLIHWEESGNKQWLLLSRIFPGVPFSTPEYEPIEELQPPFNNLLK